MSFPVSAMGRGAMQGSPGTSSWFCERRLPHAPDPFVRCVISRTLVRVIGPLLIKDRFELCQMPCVLLGVGLQLPRRLLCNLV